jgi:hypothetical protein
VVEAHRHEGVFIARGKEDSLVTRNLVPGVSVYGEKRISTEVGEGEKVEYRVWNPFRSKLAAAILAGLDNIYVKPGALLLRTCACLGGCDGLWLVLAAGLARDTVVSRSKSHPPPPDTPPCPPPSRAPQAASCCTWAAPAARACRTAPTWWGPRAPCMRSSSHTAGAAAGWLRGACTNRHAACVSALLQLCALLARRHTRAARTPLAPCSTTHTHTVVATWSTWPSSAPT